jgi:hypothetical protein
LVIIYNIGPGPGPDGRGVDESGEPTYVHMADIRCPFPREQWEAAGFEVVAMDRDDTEKVRSFARAFGWDDAARMGDSAMNLRDDLYAKYSIVRKRPPADR